jgi:hypothetical protein
MTKVSDRLPTWYIDDLRQEILCLRKMLNSVENVDGGLGGKVFGSLTLETVDRHIKAIADLQSIVNDYNKTTI